MQRDQQDSDWSRFEKTVNRDATEQKQFKMDMASYYERWVGFVPQDMTDARHPWVVSCMVTGVQLPFSSIIAGHIYPSSSHGQGLEKYGLPMSDVMHPRNGLLVVKNIEEALAVHRACFIWDIMKQELLFCVLDPALKKMNVLGKDNIDALEKNEQLAYQIDSARRLTFQDLHNRPLLHAEGCFPFRRLLARDARKTYALAASKNWITNAEAVKFFDYCALSDKSSRAEENPDDK